MFDGRVALVTGGTRGIGAAISKTLAKSGARVAAGYSKGKDAAEALQQKIASDGAEVSIHQGRVDEPDDCARVVGEVLERFGRIDYLINNAGITVDKTLRKMTYDDWHNVLDVNLFGAFCMTKNVLEHMIERGSGRIVNISSIIGETGNVGQANYAASKAGLFGFTKSLALEMSRRGITANVVAPGFIDTDMTRALDQKQQETALQAIPLQRIGYVEEVAGAISFLASED
ncbi:MAG: 3-oxoacyl-ACP reductase FabG, partial [Candidatus Eremiobacteraeota bacterium]|nr:3-oxoacyl-ACP reductase FabG [Candidatus Eremiobacteraeota bacterium]